METPVLTIIVPVYNHEKYVLKALQSIEMQNIGYSYEVIVGEDCSTDRSKEILQRYQENALENYYFIYRDSNLGMLNNISDLFYKAKGKYIIILEGDDYWIYENKINEQISFLEANMMYSGYAHSVIVVDSDGQDSGMPYVQEKGKGIYNIKDYLHGLLPGQTASFMYRNYFAERMLFQYLGNNTMYPLDRFIAFVVASRGEIYCTDKKWSAYRYITCGGSSFSANIDGKSDAFARSALLYHKSLYEYTLCEKCGRDCVKISEKLYYRSFLRDWVTSEKREFKKMLCEFKKVRYPFATFSWMFIQFICLLLKGKGK